MKYSLVPAILALTTVHAAMEEDTCKSTSDKVLEKSRQKVNKRYLWEYRDLLNAIKEGLPEDKKENYVSIDRCIEIAWMRIYETNTHDPACAMHRALQEREYEIDYKEESVSRCLKNSKNNKRILKKTDMWRKYIKHLRIPGHIRRKYGSNWWERAAFRAAFADILGKTDMEVFCMSDDIRNDDIMIKRQLKLRETKQTIDIKIEYEKMINQCKQANKEREIREKRQRIREQKSEKQASAKASSAPSSDLDGVPSKRPVRRTRYPNDSGSRPVLDKPVDNLLKRAIDSELELRFNAVEPPRFELQKNGRASKVMKQAFPHSHIIVRGKQFPMDEFRIGVPESKGGEQATGSATAPGNEAGDDTESTDVGQPSELSWADIYEPLCQ